MSTRGAQVAADRRRNVGPAGPAGRGPQRRGSATATRRTRPSPVAGLQAHVGSLARLVLEVEAGRRPLAHLQRLATPELAARLAAQPVRPGPGGRLRRVDASFTHAARAEALAVIDRGHRMTVIAFGLVRTTERWCVDALIRPELGPLPAPAYPVPHEPCTFELTGEDSGAVPPNGPVTPAA